MVNSETLHDFRNVLVVGLYFILVALPPASSAPSTLRSSIDNERNYNSSCGQKVTTFRPTDLTTNVPSTFSDSELPELLTPFLHTSEKFYQDVTEFIKNYTLKIFKKPFEEVDELFKIHDYKWLRKPESWTEPKMPKHDNSLLDMYEYFQKIAIGLEQAVSDQEPALGVNFSEMYDTSILILCEILDAMVYRGIGPRYNVDRNIMSDEFRIMDETHRRQRNFIILRDFRDALNYAIISFNSTG